MVEQQGGAEGKKRREEGVEGAVHPKKKAEQHAACCEICLSEKAS